MPLTRCQIKDLGRVVTGHTPPTSNRTLYGDLYPHIKPTDMSLDYRYIGETMESLSQAGFERYKTSLLPPNTPCVVTIGTIGKLCLTRQDSFCNQAVNAIIVNRAKHDPLYVYYLMKLTVPQVKGLSSGTASGRENVSKGVFESIQIFVHSLPEQKRIASILSSYDDLIENNARRIKILEHMAQMLYREWFVNFRFPGHERVKMTESEMESIPTGWTVGLLKDFAVFISRGISPAYDDTADGLVINQKCIRDSKLNLAPARRQSKKVPQEKMVQEGDVLINSTGVGTLGRVAQILGPIPNCTVDSHVSIVRPKVNHEFFGRVLLELEDHFTAQGIGSTGQTELSRERIASTRILIPADELVAQFCRIVSPMNKMLLSCLKRNDNLAKTRDLLLPKLVSGKVSVEQLESEVIAQNA